MIETNSVYVNNDDENNNNYFNSDAISSEKEPELDEVESLENCKVKCLPEELVSSNVEMSKEIRIESHVSHQNKTKKHARRNKRHAKHKNIVDISNSIKNDNVGNNNGSCNSERDGEASEITPARTASCNQKSIVSDEATLPERKCQNKELSNGQSKCVFVQSTSQKRFSHHQHNSRFNLNHSNRKTKLVNSPEDVHSSEYELAHHTRKGNNVHKVNIHNNNNNNNIKGRNKCKKQRNRVKRRRQRQQRGRKNNKRKHHHQQYNHHHQHHHEHLYYSPTYYHSLESEQERYSNRKFTDCRHHYNKSSSPRHHESKRRGRSCNLGARRYRSQLRSTSIKRDERNDYESKYKQHLEEEESHEIEEYEEEYKMYNGKYMSDTIFTTYHSCHHNRLPRKRHSKKRHKTNRYYCRNVNDRCEEFNHTYEDNNNKKKLERLPTRSALRRQRRLRHRARCLSERTTYASYHNRGALLNNAVHKSFRVSDLHFCSDGQCNCGTTPTYHAILQSRPVTFANDFEPFINTKCATLKTSMNEHSVDKEINLKKVINDVEQNKANIELHEKSKIVDASTGQTNVTTTTTTTVSSCADTPNCRATHAHESAHDTLCAISSNHNNKNNNQESSRTSTADQAISNCGKLYKGLYWWQLTPEAKQRYLHELKRFVLSSSKNGNTCLATITTSNSASCGHDDTIKFINTDKSILAKRVKLPEPPSYRSLSELSRAAAATLSSFSSSSCSSSSSSSSALYSSTWSNTDGRHPHRYRSESTNELLESSLSSTNSSCSEVHTYDGLEYGDGDVDTETNEQGTHRKTHLSEQEDEKKYLRRIVRQNKPEEEKYCTDYECDEYAEREEAMLLTRAKASLIYELKLEQAQTRSFGVDNDSIKISNRVINETELNEQVCHYKIEAHHASTEAICALPNSACVTNRFASSTLTNTNTSKSITKTTVARERSTGLLLLPTNQVTSPTVNSPSKVCSRLSATIPSRNMEIVEITRDNVEYTPICSDNIHHGTNEINYINNSNNDSNDEDSNDTCVSDAEE